MSNTIIVDDWDNVERYVFENRHSFSGISFLAMSVDKDYNQAPTTAVITAKDMVKKYGNAAIFASGMVVDALKVFNNLEVVISESNLRTTDSNRTPRSRIFENY